MSVSRVRGGQGGRAAEVVRERGEAGWRGCGGGGSVSTIY